MKMKKPTCPVCGSDEVMVMGALRWSPKSRRYLPVVVTEDWSCRPCNQQGREMSGPVWAEVKG